ncbi:hypothetical protein BTM_4865 [Burkholderia thailandensis 34]|uniref:ClbS/DfsB family four-helix bundle protein n=1 Tax=Burkholderia thailandensis TaxID=57975 RepID=UPI0005D92601|nr:ClbS/DfsB family four-helix bundle protein [Burkholderia thailandensis]AJY30839.1 hypothetical protein BTM_4865 [Burkholderia thailandensis 34]AOJ60403.1 hypothetical protein AQ477_28635 [Burkholderia thailandensis]KXF57394.1 hypothetical protein AQ476_21520 [Burkholderia thailandensis]
MAAPRTKQELPDAIRTAYRKLAADLADVPAKRARDAALEGHSQGARISVADRPANLIGRNRLVPKWCDTTA